MKQAMRALSKALIRGLLIVVPVYLAIILLLKGMKSVAKLVQPFTAHVPFTDAVRVISRWGSGAKNLVAAMERRDSVAPTMP